MAQAPEIERQLRQMGDGGPRRRESSLIPQGRNGLTLYIMKEALENAEIDRNDPRDVDQWYFPDEQKIVIDLDP